MGNYCSRNISIIKSFFRKPSTPSSAPRLAEDNGIVSRIKAVLIGEDNEDDCVTRQQLFDVISDRDTMTAQLVPGIRKIICSYLELDVQFVGQSGTIKVEQDGRALLADGEPKGGASTWGENFAYSKPLPKGNSGCVDVQINYTKKYTNVPDLGIGLINKTDLDRELPDGNIIRIGKFFCFYPCSDHQVLTADFQDKPAINLLKGRGSVTLRLDYDTNDVMFMHKGKLLARSKKGKFNLGKGTGDVLLAVAFRTSGDSLSVGQICS